MLFKDQTASLAEEEQAQVMCNVEKYRSKDESVRHGILDAYFQMSDYNADDYFFECGKMYENRLEQFFKEMEKAEYMVKGDRGGTAVDIK